MPGSEQLNKATFNLNIMNTITFGLFSTHESAENAISELGLKGFSSRDIYIVMIDQEIAKEVREIIGVHISEDIFGRLTELGLGKEEVQIYETNIKTGAILLGIPTIDPADTVREILEKHQASEIRSINRNN